MAKKEDKLTVVHISVDSGAPISSETQLALTEGAKILSLIVEREQTYGSTWFNYGYDGNASHLKEKIFRFLHQCEHSLSPKASIETLKDMTVWAIFCLVCATKTIRPDFDPEKYKLEFTKQQLYGDMEKLNRDDMFVLSAKFFNAMYKSYCEKKSISNHQIDELIDSLKRMKRCKSKS